MAKGREAHRARQETLTWFGRQLARRSGSACELCAADGVKLAAYEVAPVPVDPDVDRCIFICETCKAQIDNPKRMDRNHWMCLYTSIWSEVPAVQVAAVRMAKRLSSESWTSDLLDQVYLTEEIGEWIDSAEEV